MLLFRKILRKYQIISYSNDFEDSRLQFFLFRATTIWRIAPCEIFSDLKNNF